MSKSAKRQHAPARQETNAERDRRLVEQRLKRQRRVEQRIQRLARQLSIAVAKSDYMVERLTAQLARRANKELVERDDTRVLTGAAT